MNKIGLLAISLVVALFAGLIVAPYFIDWTGYRSQISDALGKTTGRHVQIDGAVDMILVPSPVLSVSDLVLSSSADAPPLMTAKRLDIRLALGALATGKLQIEQVILIDPEISLSWDDAGAFNWQTSQDAQQVAKIIRTAELSSAEVRNGKILLDHSTLAMQEQVSDLNLEISAGSLMGPYSINGSLLWRDAGMMVSATTGRVGGIAGAVPLRLQFNPIANKNDEFNFAGLVKGKSVSDESDTFVEGDLSFDLSDLALLPSLISHEKAKYWRQFLDDIGQHKFVAHGGLVIGPDGAKWDSIEAEVGQTRLNGALGLITNHTNKEIQTELSIDIKRLNLDEWLSLKEDNAPKGADTSQYKWMVLLPWEGHHKLDVSIDGVNYRQGVLRNVKAGLLLSDGAWAWENLSLQAPGGAEIKLAGQLDKLVPGYRVDTSFDVTASNFRSFLTWLDVSTDNIPQDRLRNFAVTGQLVFDPDNLHVQDLALNLDTTNIQGNLSYLGADETDINLELDVDQINFDSYYQITSFIKSKLPTMALSWTKLPQLINTTRLRLAVGFGQLQIDDAGVEGLRVVGAVNGGELDLKEISVRNWDGMQLGFSGHAKSIFPPSEVELDLSAAWSDRAWPKSIKDREISAFLSYIPPQMFESLKLDGTLKGDAGGLILDLDAKSNIGQASVAGKASSLNLFSDNRFVGALDMNLNDYKAWQRHWFTDYQPSKPLRGPMSLKSDLAIGVNGINLTKIDSKIGTLKIAGQGRIGWEEPRRTINADLRMPTLRIDDIVPGPLDQTVDRVWNKDNWGLLGRMDGKLVLKSEKFKWDRLNLTDIDLGLSWTEGELKLDKLASKLLGGSFLMSAARTTDALKATILLSDVPWAKLRGLLGLSAMPQLGVKNGTIGLDLTASAQGGDMAGWQETIKAEGKVSFRDGGWQGIDLSKADDFFTRLAQQQDLPVNQLAGDTKFDAIDGTWQMNAQEVKLTSALLTSQNGKIQLTMSQALEGALHQTDHLLENGISVILKRLESGISYHLKPDDYQGLIGETSAAQDPEPSQIESSVTGTAEAEQPEEAIPPVMFPPRPQEKPE